MLKCICISSSSPAGLTVFTLLFEVKAVKIYVTQKGKALNHCLTSHLCWLLIYFLSFQDSFFYIPLRDAGAANLQMTNS